MVGRESGQQPLTYLRPFKLVAVGRRHQGGLWVPAAVLQVARVGTRRQILEGATSARLVDLREIGDKYEWIVAKVSIFDFNIVMAPLGGDSMKSSIR